MCKRLLYIFFLSIFAFYLNSNNSFAQDKRTVTKLYGSYLKGLFAAHEGDFCHSLEELEKAKKISPDSFLIRLKIATILVRLGEIDRAEKELKKAKNLNCESLEPRLALIFLYAYTQKDKELEAEYESFLEKYHEVKPQDTAISHELGQFYFYKNKLAEAISIYEVLLANNTDDLDAIFWLGFIYEEAGRRDDAIALWTKGLSLEPDYSLILNSLAYLYAEEGINLDQAEEMAKKALAAEPENGAYLDSLGWVYFKKGDYTKAKEYIGQAAGAVKDPLIYEHLAQVHAMLEDGESVVKTYKEGLEYFPQDLKLKESLEQYEEKNKISKN